MYDTSNLDLLHATPMYQHDARLANALYRVRAQLRTAFNLGPSAPFTPTVVRLFRAKLPECG